MDRYIGMDVHAVSCTVCIVGASGRQLWAWRRRCDWEPSTRWCSKRRVDLRDFVLYPRATTDHARRDAHANPHQGAASRARDPDTGAAGVQPVPAASMARQASLGLPSLGRAVVAGARRPAELKRDAEKQPIAETHRHPISKILETCPGFSPIRTAPALPVVVTPNRFRTARQLWSYSGLGIVMRSSGDWVKRNDGWVRAETARDAP